MSDGFTLVYDDEPRGGRYDEPRPDGLYLDLEEQCWRRSSDDARVCGAHPSTMDWQYDRCKSQGIRENGRCRHHGGNTPKGPEHGAFKHGKFSDSLPDQPREKYEKAKEDKTLTTLREEIALIESRLHLVLESLEAEDSASLWKRLDEAVTELKRARDAGNAAKVAEKVAEVSSLVEDGASERSKWEEVGELIDHKRRLVDSERRREKALQAYVPIEEWKVQVQALNEVLRDHIDDRKKLQEITRDLESVLGLGR